MQIVTTKKIKGVFSKIEIPVGTVLNVLEQYQKKYLVKYLTKYWFIDKTQAKPLGVKNKHG